MRTIACRCVAVGMGVASVAGAQTPAQPLQLADRGPAFYEVGVSDGARVDAGHAAVFTQRILLRLHDAAIPDALVVIGEQAGLRFTYDQALLPTNVRVSLRADDITVAAALTQVLLDANLDIEVTPTGLASLVPRAPRARVAKQQAGTVTGHITDAATHHSIPYATVTVEDTKWGATANDSGVYRITGLASGTYTVLGRSLGYLPSRHTTTVDNSQSLIVDFALEKSASQMDRVVVTGTVVPTEVKALPTPVTVISDSEIASQRPTTVTELVRQAVPSAVAWSPPDVPYQTAFSVRGASTLSPGSGQMKVYVDGIEAADPSFAAVDPTSIARIEVIRGPEAAAIYGSDAIGGVIQIFTKHGDPDLPRPQVDVQTALGAAQTPYLGHRAVLRQSYGASLFGGTGDVGYNLGAGYSGTGNYLPNGEQSAQSSPSIHGAVHLARGAVTVDASGRYYTQNDPSVFNPRLLQTGFGYYSRPLYQPSQVASQTTGASIGLSPTTWWHHVITVGVDRVTFTAQQSRARLTTAADTLLSLSAETEEKTRVGYNTSVQGQLTSNLSGSVTAGIDHYDLPTNTFFTSGALNTTGSIHTAPGQAIFASRTTTTNTGYFAQALLSVHDALFLTAGIRAEQNTQFGDSLGVPVSPRVGLAYVYDLGTATLKLRGSYGRAIRAPNPGEKNAVTTAAQLILANPALGPERQHGWDGGIDVAFAGRGSLSVTTYEQIADQLIQQVQLSSDSIPAYQYQNVGRVRNTGIELEGTLHVSVAQVKGQYAYTRSRIEQLGPAYTGDLRVGDQSLATPKHTAGASVVVAPGRTTTVSAGLTYVGTWNEYDYVAELSCFGGTGPCRPAFRNYIVAYPSFIKANATLAQRITPFLSAFISIANLTNKTVAELVNYDPEMGRITSIGLQFHH